jgi:KUP system potassium uptake protein
MTPWFVSLAIAGITNIADDPGVLNAFNPLYAARLLANHGYIGLFTMSAIAP